MKDGGACHSAIEWLGTPGFNRKGAAPRGGGAAPFPDTMEGRIGRQALVDSAGIVEGFNNRLKLVTRKSYGFRTQNAYEIALYHNLSDLPDMRFTHRLL